MAKKSIGKVFEEEIRDSFPEDFFVERYKDDTAGFKGVDNPADFRLYKYPLTFLIECKSHRGQSLPLSKIRDSQLEGLAEAVQYYGVQGGFLINYRDLEETYYVPVETLIMGIKSIQRKSIHVDWCRVHGVRIYQSKKRVRYYYDLGTWLGGYYK